MGLKLNRRELENYRSGLNEIKWSSEQDMIEHFEGIYGKIKYPPVNESLKGWSKEQIFFRLLRTEDILYFYYDRALKKQDPALLLNVFFTYNHIESAYELASGNDHCDKFLPVLFCYSGNNYGLVDIYLPPTVGKSKMGNRLPVTVINQILAIRGALDKEEIKKDSLKFLSKKNSKLENSIVKTLLGILYEDSKGVSENLSEVTLLHKRAKWLHDFRNPMGKYLPFVSYGIYSLIYKHMGIDFLKEIEFTKSNIWWEDFQKLNMENMFIEGTDIMKFEGDLKCINEIVPH